MKISSKKTVFAISMAALILYIALSKSEVFESAHNGKLTHETIKLDANAPKTSSTNRRSGLKTHSTNDPLEQIRTNLLTSISDNSKSFDSVWNEVMSAELQHERERRFLLQDLIYDKFSIDNLEGMLNVISNAKIDAKNKDVLLGSLYLMVGKVGSFDDITTMLSDSKNKDIHITSIIDGFALRPDFADTMKWLSNNSDVIQSLTSKDEYINHLANFLAQPLQKSLTSEHDKILGEFDKFINSVKIDEKYKNDLIAAYSGAMSNRNPAVALNLFKTAVSDKIMSDKEKLLERKILGDLLKMSDTSISLQTMSEHKKIDPKNAENALYLLFKKDSNALNSWFSDEKNTENSELLTYYDGAIARALTENKDYLNAVEQSKKISDEKYRMEVESNILRLERQNVLSKFNQNPQVEIDKIINNKSEFAGNYVQDSILEWTKRDVSAANAWITVNWPKLDSDDKSDVATACVKHALSSNEIATAKQWIEYVKDPSVIDEFNQRDP